MTDVSYNTQPKTNALSIVGFILAFIFPLIGFIISIIGYNKAKEEGNKKGLAIAGIIIGLILTILNIIVTFSILPQLTGGTLTSV